MDINVQTTSHLGLRAWYEVLRTERYGQLPKYWVDPVHGPIHCSYPDCMPLAVSALAARRWELRQRRGSNHLFASRHNKLCPWQQQVGSTQRHSFTTKPLERAYVYWAQLEYKLNHK